jgi:hypothetical protein
MLCRVVQKGVRVAKTRCNRVLALEKVVVQRMMIPWKSRRERSREWQEGGR